MSRKVLGRSIARIVLNTGRTRVFQMLTGALKAARLDEVVLKAVERGKIAATIHLLGEFQIDRTALFRKSPPFEQSVSQDDAAQQCGLLGAATLEAESGAFTESGHSFRQQPNEPDRGSTPESLAAIDQIGVAIPAESLRDHQIRTGEQDGGRWFRAMGIGGAIAAAFGLGWIGGSGSHHFFAAPPSSSHSTSSPVDTGREVTGSIPNVASPNTSRGPTQSASGPINSAPPFASPVPASQHQTRSLPRPKPVATPDTRPATVQGWTVREIVGGNIVLEGPNGISQVARGDMVPGLGRIDSIVRWGNRWIVVTSRGLVTTQ
jgi:hypothetical protein